jgi:hypothetical protein
LSLMHSTPLDPDIGSFRKAISVFHLFS